VAFSHKNYTKTRNKIEEIKLLTKNNVYNVQ